MKTSRVVFLLVLFLGLLCKHVSAQLDSLTESFKNFDITRVKNTSSSLNTSIKHEELVITCKGKNNWDNTQLNFATLDLSTYPSLSFRVKSTQLVSIRIDLVDQHDSVVLFSNANPLSRSIQGNEQWNYVYFDLHNHFEQSWPTAATLNQKHITGIAIFLNPGSQFTGEVLIDDICLGKAAYKSKKDFDTYIHVSQVGFYPDKEKIAVVCGSKSKEFTVCDALKHKIVFSGKLTSKTYWKYSQDSVSVADFSLLKDTGTYYIMVSDVGKSSTFSIKNKVFENLATSSLKAFYFQRLGCDVPQKYAGKWHRPSSIPDTSVYIHPSAVSVNRPAGSKVSSPGGWFDAGDYNKYIVNSGITVYTLLAIFEQYPGYVKMVSLNIPESGNSIPDILDEILWNLRWMLTMQDPSDGGVYHKVTHANFEPMAMPNDVNEKRYMMQKSTAATLDFCAVMSQASRVLKSYSKELPGLSDSCMLAAVKAWGWAKKNPRVYYDQNVINAKHLPKVVTGTYADGYVLDEFDWAGSEMLLSTGNELVLDDVKFENPVCIIPDWGNVQSLGLFSLVFYRKFIGKQLDTSMIIDKILPLADSLVAYSQTCPFRTCMGQQKWHFGWGSNAVAANISFFLLQAFQATGEMKYYTAALNNFNYLLGCNPLGYCFVTGQGTRSPMFIHHRVSVADNVVPPVPGLLVGGPQPGREDGCWYPWDAPAKNYSDDVLSYSTNEVAINWNAPLAYLACAFEAIESKKFPCTKENPRSKLLFPEIAKLPKLDSLKKREYIPIIVYPNEKTGSFQIQLALLEPAVLEIKDADGRVIVHDYIEKTGTVPRDYPVNLHTGTYIITLDSKNLHKSHTIMINP